MCFRHSKERSRPSFLLALSSSIRWFEGFREKPGCQLNYQRVHVTGAPRLRDWSAPGNSWGSAGIRRLAKHIPRCHQRTCTYFPPFL